MTQIFLSMNSNASMIIQQLSSPSKCQNNEIVQKTSLSKYIEQWQVLMGTEHVNSSSQEPRVNCYTLFLNQRLQCNKER